MNAAAAGKVYPDAPFTVDPERVAAFRAVFDEVTGVPATFATAAEFTAIPISWPIRSSARLLPVSCTSQEYAFERPLTEGENPHDQEQDRVDPGDGRERVPGARDRAGRSRRGHRVHGPLHADRAAPD